MLDKCSPVIVVEPATIQKRKCDEMIPVVEAEELLQINSFVHANQNLKQNQQKNTQKNFAGPVESL
jgi:hypothetical protein